MTNDCGMIAEKFPINSNRFFLICSHGWKHIRNVTKYLQLIVALVLRQMRLHASSHPWFGPKTTDFISQLLHEQREGLLLGPPVSP